MTEQFYFVWNVNGSAPRYRHISFEAAKKEAERLAENHPRDEFIILQSLGSVKKLTTTYEAHESMENYIPF